MEVLKFATQGEEVGRSLFVKRTYVLFVSDEMFNRNHLFVFTMSDAKYQDSKKKSVGFYSVDQLIDFLRICFNANA